MRTGCPAACDAVPMAAAEVRRCCRCTRRRFLAAQAVPASPGCSPPAMGRWLRLSSGT